MKLRIIYFKKSGKYYSEHVIEHGKDIKIWDKEFYLLIKNNSGVKNPNEFYIVVEDLNDNQSSHQTLIMNLEQEIKNC